MRDCDSVHPGVEMGNSDITLGYPNNGGAAIPILSVALWHGNRVDLCPYKPYRLVYDLPNALPCICLRGVFPLSETTLEKSNI